ncbi:MAG: glycosyltransferase family 1 protein [Bryobacteraceae bacterium]
MRVLIDATPLLLRSAGVKTYIYYWTRHLRRLAGPDAVRLFPFLREPAEWGHERSVLPRLSTMARLGFLAAANYTPLPLLGPLGRSVKVFHASHQLVRPPRNTALTATIYDMTCWLVPEMHAAANVAKARQFAKSVIGRADALIAISETTRQDAVRLLGIDDRKIEVIYPGVAEAFFKTGPESGPAGKPYILFVGTVEPRKNLAVLLDAYAQLAPSIRDEFDLVIAGSAGWGDPSLLRRLQQGEPGVRYLGYVPEHALPALNAGASVFVYPSLYEGFGLPVAQAMAAGVPVITSNTSCLPEVAGDAALLIDPRSPAELTAALERLLTSPSQRSTRGSNGLRRAEAYRWDVCAQLSWRFFQRIGA